MQKESKNKYSYEIGETFDRSKPELCSKDPQTGFLTVYYEGVVFQLDDSHKQTRAGKETLIHASGSVRFLVDSSYVKNAFKIKNDEK